jgi:hypothetical protein
MTLQDSNMRHEAGQVSRDRSNLRLGLTLGAVALVLFFGFILRYWLLGR